MTEQEWLQHNDPEPMLVYLRGQVIDRKLRLFACACCRRIWHLLSDESRNLIEVLEGREDGRATPTEFSILERNYEFIRGATPNTAAYEAATAVRAAAGMGAWAAAWKTVSKVRQAIGLNVEGRIQAALLRDIAHNPMQPYPSLHPAILTWHDSLLVSIAQRMYDSRDFSDMPVLADALEEAGCQDQDILGHCRSGGEHVRGCWVVDLLLGKE